MKIEYYGFGFLKVGLCGEKLQIYTDEGSGNVQWNNFESSQPLSWYKVRKPVLYNDLLMFSVVLKKYCLFGTMRKKLEKRKENEGKVEERITFPLFGIGMKNQKTFLISSPSNCIFSRINGKKKVTKSGCEYC